MGGSQTFPAVLDANGGLTLLNPGMGGTGTVTVNFARNGSNELTAILNFAGSNQALITFDASNSIPVSYQLYSASPDNFIEQSVCNIMRQISGFIPSI